MVFTKKIALSVFMLLGCASTFVHAQNTNQSVTPLMTIISDFEIAIKKIKYGHDSLAYARSMLYESYFLGGTYAAFGPLVSDVIEAKVVYVSKQIKNETDAVIEKMKALHISIDDFNQYDCDGKTVMQYCTMKESYDLLRAYGAEFKMNRAVRIYGRYYAPALLDYAITPYVIAIACHLDSTFHR